MRQWWERTLEDMDNLDPWQSLVQIKMETVWLTLMDGLWQNLKGGNGPTLALLDLSAVFNIVNHGILLDCSKGLKIGSSILW